MGAHGTGSISLFAGRDVDHANGVGGKGGHSSGGCFGTLLSRGVTSCLGLDAMVAVIKTVDLQWLEVRSLNAAGVYEGARFLPPVGSDFTVAGRLLVPVHPFGDTITVALWQGTMQQGRVWSVEPRRIASGRVAVHPGFAEFRTVMKLAAVLLSANPQAN